MIGEKPRKVDVVEKVKLRAGDLRKGMYVCELDRPWLETPFLLQGFEIKTDADIQAVMGHCEYVYIDMLRTKVVSVEITAIPPRSYANEKKIASLERDLAAAENVRRETSALLKTFFDDIRFGNCVDIQLARSAVSECVASIMRNPDAMIFLTQLRQKDEYSSRHSFNVCVYSIMLGRSIEMDAKELENLGTCALLHDVGKAEIPDHILNKKSRLTEEERAILREHTTRGRDILMSARNMFSGTVDVAYGHHENMDGTGYPRGLQGHQLNQNCKIVAVADKYDAIGAARPYKAGHDHLEAVAILNKLAKENKIDPALAANLVSHLGVYPPGSTVELSTGEAAIVLESKPNRRLRPIILVARDAEGNPVERYVDMAEVLTDERGRPYKIKSVHKPGDFDIDLEYYQSAIIRAFN
jgi:HD-GYP domain-containing protein (c-di-GMP phosphodiesterase class II)